MMSVVQPSMHRCLCLDAVCYSYRMRPCDHCGRQFTPWPQNVARGGGRFCSRECLVWSWADVERRLEARRVIDPVTGCWLWTGGKNRQGYGVIGVSGTVRLVHRVAASLYLGLER